MNFIIGYHDIICECLAKANLTAQSKDLTDILQILLNIQKVFNKYCIIDR